MAKKKKAAVKGTKTSKPKKAKPAKAVRRSRANRLGGEALIPPPGGAAIRSYRIGHGDCFLIAFEGETPERPAYVLIDCGYKPGSPRKLEEPTKARDIGQHIVASTGGFIDVAIVTHEHQDHVNGFTSENFADLKVGKVWFAWTENPEDDVANQLRKKFKDRLLRMIDTRANLMALGKTEAADDIDLFLELELGEEVDSFNGAEHLAAAGKDPATSANKVAMKFLTDCADGEPEYLYPHQKIVSVPGAKQARAFSLGPPRNIDIIDDLDPVGDETFGDDTHGIGVSACSGAVQEIKSPFSRRHIIPLDQALSDAKAGAFFRDYYGDEQGAAQEADDGNEISRNAGWRRLTAVDTADAGSLALAMNNATNNASLVLAFEISKGGKVLLFVGDAQAGNWRSWSDDKFDDDGTDITAEDLLRRTVLYKVGHHGSHNATLKGKAGSHNACLAIMAQGKYASEFVAIITAVEAWAHQKPKPNWNHPLPAIKQTLLKKANGRVLQTDSPVPTKPASDATGDFQDFLERVKVTPLFFDLMVNG